MYKDADIEVDFSSDWLAFMRHAFASVGYSNIPADDEGVEIAYFNVLHREIPPRARKIHVAQSLVCPPAHQAGYDELRRRVEAGELLRPYQSTSLDNLEFGEGQLNDWGIHHLHLGAKVGPKGKFIERTGPVLFAAFKSNDAYFIAIQNHGPGFQPWSDVSILEEMHRNWPHLVVGLPGLSASGQNPTHAEIEAARRGGVTALLNINGIVVFPPGRGVTTKQPKNRRSGSALGVAVVERMDRAHEKIERFEQLVVQNIAQILGEAAKHNVELSRPVRFKLQVRSDGTASAISGDLAFGFPLGKFS